VRVLLLWPGSGEAVGGNFGVPQLVLLATYAHKHTTAKVDICDVIGEQLLGVTSFPAMLGGPQGTGYDIIGFSVYSSFDHLKCEALAQLARELYPQALIVAGGYHPSACPEDFVYPGSPYDVAVVGEGERPLVTIIESVEGGEPLRETVLGPMAIDDMSTLPVSDWSLLERYRPIARRYASQAQIYLSRGCPYDCAFCMERVKRETSWRPLPVERALEEIQSLHSFIDLDGWTLYVADALFGMKRSWRREFLEGLARLNLPIQKIWFLIRVDLVEEEDLRLFRDANASPGFGLESGDPVMLKTIRKKGRLDDYLLQMEVIAAKAREIDLPWGANVICGHPGETPATLERSAAFLKRLFLDPKGTTGFLSVDPFRLYPGSPIDAERGHYERTYGTRFHRPGWWNDGDPEFLSEWVDPSRELDYLSREALQNRHMTPILKGLEENYVYGGKARDYYLRAIREQVSFNSDRGRWHYLSRYYAWKRYLGQGANARVERRGHADLGEVGRRLREECRHEVAASAHLEPEHELIDLVLDTPRERFVPLDRIHESDADAAVSLAPEGAPDDVATLSAMHAYVRALDLLDVQPADRVLDLGGGSGFGAAVFARRGASVVSLEVDPALVGRAREELRALGLAVTCAVADALDPNTWPQEPGSFSKVSVGFALEAIPQAWDAFLPGTVVVAPLVHQGAQRLSRLLRSVAGWDVERLEEVRYVATRSLGDPAPLGARALPTV
jgi:protein-L-isoaspartate O-methyltransferase/radical SAM superfamily enzyme YgiQ (UPF0313 family)